MNKNSLNIVNSKLIFKRDNYCLSPYKIRDYKEYNYRRLSRNR